MCGPIKKKPAKKKSATRPKKKSPSPKRIKKKSKKIPTPPKKTSPKAPGSVVKKFEGPAAHGAAYRLALMHARKPSSVVRKSNVKGPGADYRLALMHARKPSSVVRKSNVKGPGADYRLALMHARKPSSVVRKPNNKSGHGADYRLALMHARKPLSKRLSVARKSNIKSGHRADYALALQHARKPLHKKSKTRSTSFVRKSNTKPGPSEGVDYRLALASVRQLEKMRKPYSADLFRKIKNLGMGSFGIAMLVERRDNGQRLVLKRLRKHAELGAETAATSWDALVSEISTLRHLAPVCGNHIVCYDGFFEDANNYYVTTAFLGNMQPLEALIGKLPDKIIARVIDNLVIGLSLIHARGIAHRDIKPGNILVDPKTGEVRYIDFGVACWEEQCTTLGAQGTKIYSPPGIFDSGRKGSLNRFKAQDAWSLGTTIWELLHGKPNGYMIDVWHRENPHVPGLDAYESFWKTFSYARMNANHPEIEKKLRSLHLNVDLKTLDGLLSSSEDERLQELLWLRAFAEHAPVLPVLKKSLSSAAKKFPSKAIAAAKKSMDVASKSPIKLQSGKKATKKVKIEKPKKRKGLGVTALARAIADIRENARRK